MGDTLGKGFSEILVLLSGVIALAIVAVLVSQKAQTGSVLKAGGDAFSSLIKAAVSPVSGP
jgi:PRD1 phage membrane DNA delivery